MRETVCVGASDGRGVKGDISEILKPTNPPFPFPLFSFVLSFFFSSSFFSRNLWGTARLFLQTGDNKNRRGRPLFVSV